MPPIEPDSEPRTPPAASSRADVDFDPEIDVAPTAQRAAARPDLAAALAQADEELRWAGDVKPSEQQAYLKPTTLPRGLVAPTLDMSAVRVREGLDPRKAMTVRIGGERSAEPPPSSAAISGAAPSGSRRRPWGRIAGGFAAIVVLGILTVRAALSGSTGPESAASVASVEIPSAAIDTSTGGASSASASPEVAPASTGVEPVPTAPRPSPPPTAEPRVTSAPPKPSIAAPIVTSASAATTSSAPIATTQPSAAPKASVAPTSTGKVTPLFKPE